MIEKYRVQIAGDGVMFAAINNETERAVGFGGEDLMKTLCAKLNRLAAQEVVCREIVEMPCKNCNGALWGNEYTNGFNDGKTQTEASIIQKLKAVLEKEQS